MNSALDDYPRISVLTVKTLFICYDYNTN